MSIDVEYAIKKDIRNNPVVREVDGQQKRDFLRLVSLAALTVGLLLFSAWQRYVVIESGYRMQTLQAQRAAEQALNRKLHLEVEMLRAPQRIEQIALRQLHMVTPGQKDTLVIERAHSSAVDSAVVAYGGVTVPAPLSGQR